MNEKLIIIATENAQFLRQVFSELPNNRVGIIKDYLQLNEKEIEILYDEYLLTKFKKLIPRKETKRTALLIENLRSVGVHVDKNALSISVPYNSILNNLHLESIDSLKKFGYTPIYATIPNERELF